MLWTVDVWIYIISDNLMACQRKCWQEERTNDSCIQILQCCLVCVLRLKFKKEIKPQKHQQNVCTPHCTKQPHYFLYKHVFNSIDQATHHICACYSMHVSTPCVPDSCYINSFHSIWSIIFNSVSSKNILCQKKIASPIILMTNLHSRGDVVNCISAN